MKAFKKIIWGIVLVVAAVLLALNAFDVIDVEIFFDGWWTLFIIIPCFVGIFEKGDRIGNVFGLLLGVCLLASAQNWFDFDIFWKLLIPVAIACVGINMILSSFRKKEFSSKYKKTKVNSKQYYKTVTVFSGTELDHTDSEFEGAKLITCFGGIDCDLRGAIIDKDVVIDVCCIFGGIDILVPDNVKVVHKTNSVLGGVDLIKNDPSAEHTIYVEGFCMFGEIDIK